MEVFGDETRVPRATRCRDEAGDEIREDSRQYDGAPLLAAAEREHTADFLEFAGYRERAWNDVEEDVPLRPEPTLAVLICCCSRPS